MANGQRAEEDSDDARQAIEAANRVKDEFLATLSHELRTPLSAILMWSQLLDHDGVSREKLIEGIRAIRASAQAQQKLIADLLDTSRLAMGKLRLDMRPVDLAAIVRELAASAGPSAQARNITLDVKVDPDVGAICGDPDRVRQVIWNLLANALKFTRQGGHVWMRLQRRAGDAELAVSDDGVGIAADFVPHLFEKFRQSEAGTTRATGGLGLGLAICRQLVEMHGGTIRAESDGPGRGATFTVAFPLHVPTEREDAGAETVSGSDEGERDALKGVRVLLVEDDAGNREAMEAVLSEVGMSVTTVDSVAAALSAFDARSPQVIVSDIGMTEQDGYDLIRAVRERESARGKGEKVPAIALTAFARDVDRFAAANAGFQAHVAKPANVQELLDTIELLLEAATSADRLES